MTFEECLEVVLKYEGTSSNNQHDPGGETKYGISKRAYPDLDIMSLTKNDAARLYRLDYWERLKCEQLPKQLRLILFDCGVNQGVQTAIRLLQTAAQLTPDGVMGPETLERIRSLDIGRLVRNLAKLRYERYLMSPKFCIFGEGWTKRLIDVSIRSIDATR